MPTTPLANGKPSSTQTDSENYGWKRESTYLALLTLTRLDTFFNAALKQSAFALNIDILQNATNGSGTSCLPLPAV
jgi:hypothetical protein